jgi:hypothetical protein
MDSSPDIRDSVFMKRASADACSMAMTHDDHHAWVNAAGNALLVPGSSLAGNVFCMGA